MDVFPINIMQWIQTLNFVKKITSHSDLFSCLHTCSKKKKHFVVSKLETEIETKLTKMLTL